MTAGPDRAIEATALATARFPFPAAIDAARPRLDQPPIAAPTIGVDR
jgi:hypothetical protein